MCFTNKFSALRVNDDFKLKKPFGFHGLYNIMSAL